MQDIAENLGTNQADPKIEIKGKVYNCCLLDASDFLVKRIVGPWIWIYSVSKYSVYGETSELKQV